MPRATRSGGLACPSSPCRCRRSLRLDAPGATAGRRALQSPAEAIDILGRFEQLGVDHVALGFPMPDEHVYLDQIAYFGTEVLPAFARAEARGAVEPRR